MKHDLTRKAIDIYKQEQILNNSHNSSEIAFAEKKIEELCQGLSMEDFILLDEIIDGIKNKLQKS